ncbi:penicillin-binding protein 1A [Thiomonas bhubaneswarensis]|uniref:Penicillin-binding protein 1A n=1 Tax=Thiomonas bhubaneswarensis TaxID=339866 RepID=A0A0K6HT18_9BURK|nr:penicillin-binding protein 1A [Thiomonas bhubaneswarensis]CUA94039.1 penicillin-binding protein, 1A family [Thiomonas bhubaneswarensis]
MSTPADNTPAGSNPQPSGGGKRARRKPSSRPLWLRLLLGAVLLGVAALLGLVFAVVMLYPRLPALSELTDYRPDLPLRVYTAEGTLIGEFGVQRRTVVPFDQIPLRVRQAFLAAEDSQFYEHGAVDWSGVFRAALADLMHGAAVQGASTITMQVARDFYLSPQKTPLRKFTEALMAYKIEHELSKDQILERYLNQVYLGQRAYGVAAASQVYYGKPLDQLSLAQIAVLAGLPKAPSAFNPQTNIKAALIRQHYVLGRMLALGDITRAEYDHAMHAPLDVVAGQGLLRYKVDADYAAEQVREIMVARFGESAYTDGYKVYTTLHDKDQAAAVSAVHSGVLAYDQRHGWRGPQARIDLPPHDADALGTATKALKAFDSAGGLYPAVVLHASPKLVEAVLATGNTVELSGDALRFAAAGLSPKATAKQRIDRGSVVWLQKLAKGWRLAQMPDVQSALVSLDPKDGAVRAWVGGFDYNQEKFDHVNQAFRQPGSSFKPFIYSAAVDEGLAPTTIIDDSPITLNPGPGQPPWTPHNYDNERLGAVPASLALAHSDNVCAVKVLLAVGIPYARQFASRFGLPLDQIPPYPTMVLGAGSFTPLQMATAYAVFANGGSLVEPYLIKRIVDAHGAEVYAHKPVIAGQSAPRIISAANAFLTTQMLQAVIQHGTGAAALSLGRVDLAGKTGTSQNFHDAWFDGFNPDLVAITWMGYNNQRDLYRGEQGAKAALPIWMDYMRVALQGKPDVPWPVPPGIISAQVNPATGFASSSSSAVTGYFLQNFPPLAIDPELPLSASSGPLASGGVSTGSGGALVGPGGVPVGTSTVSVRGQGPGTHPAAIAQPVPQQPALQPGAILPRLTP